MSAGVSLRDSPIRIPELARTSACALVLIGRWVTMARSCSTLGASSCVAGLDERPPFRFRFRSFQKYSSKLTRFLPRKPLTRERFWATDFGLYALRLLKNI